VQTHVISLKLLAGRPCRRSTWLSGSLYIYNIAIPLRPDSAAERQTPLKHYRASLVSQAGAYVVMGERPTILLDSNYSVRGVLGYSIPCKSCVVLTVPSLINSYGKIVRSNLETGCVATSGGRPTYSRRKQSVVHIQFHFTTRLSTPERMKG